MAQMNKLNGLTLDTTMFLIDAIRTKYRELEREKLLTPEKNETYWHLYEELRAIEQYLRSQGPGLYG